MEICMLNLEQIGWRNCGYVTIYKKHIAKKNFLNKNTVVGPQNADFYKMESVAELAKDK